VNFKAHIRTIAHFPKPGIMFRDVTTLLKDAHGFKASIQHLAGHYADRGVHKVAGVESRGFIFGAALAFQLGVGFVPIRKKGKLPAKTIGRDYELEYSTDRLEMHVDAIEKGENVVVVDDLVATGGTAEASCMLIELAGGNVLECCFIVDLIHLGGSRRLNQRGWKVVSLCEFETE
jgi:adenine phosphoribosyltransferase